MCKVLSWLVTALLTFGIGVAAARVAGEIMSPTRSEEELTQFTVPAEKEAKLCILILCPCGNEGTITLSSPCGRNKPFEIEVDGVVQRRLRGNPPCRRDKGKHTNAKQGALVVVFAPACRLTGHDTSPLVRCMMLTLR